MGEGITDATITQWLKVEGDQVEKFDALVEVNTDKVDTEIPSPISGTVLKIMQLADTVVAVNQTLCWVGEPGEEIPIEDSSQSAEAPQPAKPEEKVVSTLPQPKPTPPPSPAVHTPQISTGKHLKGAVSPLAARIAADHSIDPQGILGSGLGGMVTQRDVLLYLESGGANRSPSLQQETAPDPSASFISPVVARLATEYGIDLNRVKGTGRGGRITKYDMEREIEYGGGKTIIDIQPHPAFSEMQAGTGIRHTPVRRSIANHMLESKQTSPHVSTFIEADISAVSAHRVANKTAFAQQGIKLTFTAYFVYATAAALKAYSIVNSSWAEDEIILHPEINIGIAVSLDAEGLIVPVIRNAGQLNLMQTAQAVNDLANRARNKQLTPQEVRGGTFTITNHGTSGSLFATPIINQPQCGILGTGAIQQRPVVIDDAISIRPMMYLSLTFDHRILDGAVADYFLAAIRQKLESGSFV
jgi:2-oxoglutarate dehydrogenase E2 component (dihydrolipoamide succinyltransferase)